MDKKFWDCHCLTDYVQVKTAAVCEKCQALKVNKEGYDIIESYKLKHQSKEGQHEDSNRGITEG